MTSLCLEKGCSKKCVQGSLPLQGQLAVLPVTLTQCCHRQSSTARTVGCASSDFDSVLSQAVFHCKDGSLPLQGQLAVLPVTLTQCCHRQSSTARTVGCASSDFDSVLSQAAFHCKDAPSFCDIHMASKVGDLAKVMVILSEGRVDIDCKEWKSRTPVLLAAGQGHKDVVHLLVSNGASVSVVDDFGINLLHSACQGGDVALVKYVLSLHKHDINGKVLCGGTSLMLAAENGHRNVVELLVGQGANVSLHDNKGNNVLHFACRGGDVEVVKYVLAQDMVDINSRGWKRMTPAMMAAQKGNREVLELLVNKGVKVSLMDKKGNNILHFACRKGHVEVVEHILSENMVDINSKNKQGMIPVFMAAEKGHKEVVELLFRSGGDMSLTSRGGSNVLHFACRGGNVDLVKFVLSHKMTDINSTGRRHLTPVLTAAAEGHKEVVELLVSEGAKVSLLDIRGNSILHLACRGGHVEVVKYVVSQDLVDINSRNKKGMTPVMMAAGRGHQEVVGLLMNPRMAYTARLAALIMDSKTPPKLGARGGLNFQITPLLANDDFSFSVSS
ncbi:putative ankyrin repeat protein RF_0381 [Haliotis asinina]|uniref:putative ankyrin repeat protein RF_0381 n=1 Tax=Haliotis asinina TaxID=109174 RepID=UPI0035321FA4